MEALLVMRFSLILAALAVSAVAFAQVSIDTTFQISYASNLDKGDSEVNITNTGLQGPFGVSNTLPGNICANVFVFDAQEEEISCCSCLVTPNGLNSLSARNDLISNTLTPAIPNSIVIKIVGSQPEISSSGSRTVCNPGNLADGSNHILDFPANGLLAWGTNTHVGAGGSLFYTEMPFRPALLPTPGLPVVIVASTTTGNNQVTVSTTTGLAVGQVVSAAQIPAGTIITGIGGPNSVFLSNNATSSNNAIPLVFSSTPTAADPTEYSQLATICRFIQSDGTGFGICNSCRTGALSGTKQ
jgi:hypothetical protein